MKQCLLLVPLILLSGCDVEVSHNDDKPEVSYLQLPGMEERNLPFSSAVRVGNTLYLSGNLGNLPGTLELGPETRQTMENIKNVLETFGSSMDEVVKCTVFLANMDEWGAMNEVYKTYFKNPPARSALGTSGLALNASVEIECIAITQ